MAIVPQLPEGWFAQGFSVLSGGRLALVGADADLHAAFQSNRAQTTVGEAWRLAAQASGRVWSLKDDELIYEFQFPLLEPFPRVDQFPDGRWLVVNARSSGQRNARVLALDGKKNDALSLAMALRTSRSMTKSESGWAGLIRAFSGTTIGDCRVRNGRPALMGSRRSMTTAPSSLMQR